VIETGGSKPTPEVSQLLPNPRFLGKPLGFWASVRTVSQTLGYTVRGQNAIKVPTIDEISAAFEKLGLDAARIKKSRKATKLANELVEYFRYRADVLIRVVEPLLMSAKEAKKEFTALRRRHSPSCPLPMNKQKGAMKEPAFFTCIINMLIDANSKGCECDFDPRALTTITRDGAPLRTLARRVDGAFPSAVNPIAVWEIKEYYYTTTFGSRVADGVYETLLDGMELQELRVNETIRVKHYLMVDARYTWWDCGKSYLCRIIDMLHMEYVDEVLFGREVLQRMPVIVREWVDEFRRREGA